MKHLYKQQMASAKHRGINFLLTYEQWLEIWEDSGHLADRGTGIGKYCMSRKGDVGPYAVDNVFIQLGANNTRDAIQGKKREPFTDSWKAKQAVSQSKAISIDGVDYQSSKIASETLGIPRGTICGRLKKGTPGYRYL